MQKSDDIDHYLVLCKLHIAKAVIQLLVTSFVETSLLPRKTALQVIFLMYVNSSAYPTAKKLDDVTETMDSLFSQKSRRLEVFLAL